MGIILLCAVLSMLLGGMLKIVHRTPLLIGWGGSFLVFILMIGVITASFRPMMQFADWLSNPAPILGPSRYFGPVKIGLGVSIGLIAIYNFVAWLRPLAKRS